MKKEPFIVDWGAFISGDAADHRRLVDIFCAESAGGDCLNLSPGIVLSKVIAPREVYEAYMEMYDQSLSLVSAMRAVMADPKHINMMDEAHSLGYDLPDLQGFCQNVEHYNAFLTSINPYDVRLWDDGCVLLSTRTARQLYELTYRNCLMVADVFSGCFQSEYMRHFSFRKKIGMPYDGKTALQETVNVLLGMVRTSHEISRQIEAGRQRHDWPRYIGGPMFRL